jgi:hypothetical protein
MKRARTRTANSVIAALTLAVTPVVLSTETAAAATGVTSTNASSGNAPTRPNLHHYVRLHRTEGRDPRQPLHHPMSGEWTRIRSAHLREFVLAQPNTLVELSAPRKGTVRPEVVTLQYQRYEHAGQRVAEVLVVEGRADARSGREYSLSVPEFTRWFQQWQRTHQEADTYAQVLVDVPGA